MSTDARFTIETRRQGTNALMFTRGLEVPLGYELFFDDVPPAGDRIVTFLLTNAGSEHLDANEPLRPASLFSVGSGVDEFWCETAPTAVAIEGVGERCLRVTALE